MCSCASLNGGWHSHCSQGSVLCALTPACQHLPGHAEPGQSAQHTREGVWPPVGARALSPEGRERREGCRLCSTTSVLLGAKSSLHFIPVGPRPGQPLSAFEPRGHSLLRQLCACFTTSFRGMWILAGLGKPPRSRPLWTAQGPGTPMRCFQTRGLPGMLATRSV